MKNEASDDPSGQPWPNPFAAWYVVGVLIVAYLVALVDRQILTLLVQPIRRDLGLTDTQLSLLIGLAFAVLYTVAGIPIARLADRRPRRTIIAIGVFFWSVMTFLCGLAQNYWQLFLARVGVGVGEAALQPSAYSMLSDYFPPHRLGRAIGTYSIGLFLGGGLALIVGGAVIGALSGADSTTLPILGEVRNWQLAFLVVGAPGILLTLVIMLTVKEPARRGVARTASGGAGSAELTLFFRSNFATVSRIIAAFSFGGIAVVGYLAWVPESLRRSFGWEMSDIGYAFGLVMAVFGTAGTLFGGWFVDRLARRGYRDAPMRASIIAFAFLVPAAVAAPLMPTAEASLVVLAVLLFFIGMQQGYSPVALQLITPNQLRAQVIAVYFFIAQIIALGIGPTLIAVVTDFVFRDDAALAWSLALVGGVAGGLGLLCLVAARKPYLSSVARAADWSDAATETVVRTDGASETR
jgi:MFS family permease